MSVAVGWLGLIVAAVSGITLTAVYLRGSYPDRLDLGTTLAAVVVLGTVLLAVGLTLIRRRVLFMRRVMGSTRPPPPPNFEAILQTMLDEVDDGDLASRISRIEAVARRVDEQTDRGTRQAWLDAFCLLPEMPSVAASGSTAVIRRTIVRIIAQHLRPRGVGRSWQGYHFKFFGSDVDESIDFSGIELRTGTTLSFRRSRISGKLDFGDSRLSGGSIDFLGTTFNRAEISFTNTRFDGTSIDFQSAGFNDSNLSFANARFGRSRIRFDAALLVDSHIDFHNAVFKKRGGGIVDLSLVAALSEPPRGVPADSEGLRLPDLE